MNRNIKYSNLTITRVKNLSKLRDNGILFSST
jgi:hypothetical protein